MKFFEEFVVGERREIGSHTFTAEEIKRFATAFDPQPFHLDEAAAAESHFGGLCASGWHTLAAWMRLYVRAVREQTRQAQEAGRPLAKLGPSPGFEQLKWLKPVYAGDTISYESEVVAARVSHSRPGWGLVTNRIVGRNQSGEEAIAFSARVFVERRDKSPPEADD